MRDLIKELRSSAPKCFVTAEEEEETMPREGVKRLVSSKAVIKRVVHMV